MKIGILITGDVAEPLQAQHGGYAAMFERMFAAVDPAFSFRTWRVLDGDHPESPTDAEGWIITGSKHGVYDNLPWMGPLKAFLRDVHAARIPMIGICFGHQILADALGGKVEKSEKGWGVGVHEYTLKGEAPLDRLALYAMHQDQVVAPPDNATVVASSPFCEYAVLAYGDHALSMQPHPEFEPGFARDLLLRRRGDGVPEPLADAALESFSRPVEANATARWLAGFLRNARKQ